MSSSNSPIVEPNYPPGFQPPQQSQQSQQPVHHEDFAKNECYICKGIGHWARNCTSLPSVYLVDNPPKCYSCHGVGHYARFCPNVLMGKTPLFRRRANSEPIGYLYNAPPALFGFPPLHYPDDDTVYFYDQVPVITYNYDASSPNIDSSTVIIEEELPRSAIQEEARAQTEASIDIIDNPPSPQQQPQQ